MMSKYWALMHSANEIYFVHTAANEFFLECVSKDASFFNGYLNDGHWISNSIFLFGHKELLSLLLVQEKTGTSAGIKMFCGIFLQEKLFSTITIQMSCWLILLKIPVGSVKISSSERVNISLANLLCLG